MQGLESGEGGREALERVIANKYFNRPFQVILRAKLDNYNGEPRPNITCVEAKPISLSQRAHVMLDEINSMLAASGTQAVAAAGACAQSGVRRRISKKRPALLKSEM